MACIWCGDKKVAALCAACQKKIDALRKLGAPL